MSRSETRNPDTRPRLVVGLGATGLSVARHLAREGLPFAVTDSRTSPPGAAALAELGEVPCHFGGFASPLPPAELAEAVVSPGIGLDEPFVRELRAAGVPVTGDIELFARALAAREDAPQVIAITGSNGKSTVTALVAAMARAAGRAVAAGGNLGPPALDLLAEPAALYVLELSSFQLERTESLAPSAAAVLNLSADHMDRHGSLADYAAAKARIFRHAAIAVVNGDDPEVVAMATGNAERVTFGAEAGQWHLAERNDRTWLCRDGEPVIGTDELALRGRHNWLNALAALALAEAVALPRAAACTALREFAGLPHRCQHVASVGGIDWINDSKGTNVGAVIASLEGLAGPIVLLAGGQAKGADFTPVAAVLERKGRAAVLFGADAETLAAALQGTVPVERVPGLREAVTAAADIARPGDTVLLSPGCASFDQFRDYQDRGDQFVAAVRERAA